MESSTFGCCLLGPRRRPVKRAIRVLCESTSRQGEREPAKRGSPGEGQMKCGDSASLAAYRLTPEALQSKKLRGSEVLSSISILRINHLPSLSLVRQEKGNCGAKAS